MKNDKEDVLKELLAKQEHLKLLERKKQMSIRKQVDMIGPGNMLKVFYLQIIMNFLNIHLLYILFFM